MSEREKKDIDTREQQKKLCEWQGDEWHSHKSRLTSYVSHKHWVRYVLIILIVVTSVGNAGCGLSTHSGMDIYVLDIGQGDATLIRHGKDVILIDTGDVDHRENIVAQLRSLGIRHVRAIIVSHAHADHLGGVYAILGAIPVDAIYDTGIGSTQSVYRTYRRLIQEKRIPHHTLQAGQTVTLSKDIVFCVFAPTQPYITKHGKADLNENSIVGKLTYHTFSMLFTGDAGAAEEARLIKAYNTKLSSQILKVGHHGSNYSSTTDFIRSVRPEVAVISCGLHNRYGHPGSTALSRIGKEKVVNRQTQEKENIRVLRTDTQGRLYIHTTGKGYTMRTER